MARTRRRKSYRRKSRRMRGGSATSFGMAVHGDGATQMARSMGTQRIPGPMPNLNLIQSAGRRKSRRSKRFRGGFLGEVVSQAAVPLALLGMQQKFGKKRR